MRTALTFVMVALVACLCIAAALLLASGRSFVYAPGIGATHRGASWLPWASAGIVAGAVLGTLLHAAARAFPRKYYQLLWWRDAAWLVAALAALAAALLYFARMFSYGMP